MSPPGDRRRSTRPSAALGPGPADGHADAPDECRPTTSSSIPSWSRDGNSIVYATWDDDADRLDPRRSRPAAKARVVTRAPGHYVEPALLARRAAGRLSRTIGDGFYAPQPVRAEYWRSTCAGQRRRTSAAVTERRRAIRSSAATVRPHLLLTIRAEQARGSDLGQSDGGDRPGARHRRERDASSRISPDEKWRGVGRALQRLRRAVRRPARRRDRARPRSPIIRCVGSRATPGDYLHWSRRFEDAPLVPRSRALPRDLSDAFALPRGAARELPDAPADRDRRSASRSRTGQPERQARARRRHGDHDERGRGDRERDGPRRGQSHRRGRAGRSRQRSGRARDAIDARGKTIMPGIIDVHWHGSASARTGSSRSRTGSTTRTSPSA